jgi:hypothetical protein
MVFQVNNSDNICDLMLQGNGGGYYVRFLLFQVNMLLCVKKKSKHATTFALRWCKGEHRKHKTKRTN